MNAKLTPQTASFRRQLFPSWKALAAATMSLLPLSLHAGESAKLSGKEPVANFESASAIDWKDAAIGPVSNPVWFEDPRVFTSIRPLYMFHRIDDNFTIGGADVQLMGAQIRVALTERLGLIINNGVYIHFNPENGSTSEGMSNIGGGFKYVLIDNEEHQFIVTPQLTFMSASGSRDVFQGAGSGEINAAVSVGKGFDKLLLLTNLGVRMPLDQGKQVNQFHYSFHASYNLCDHFIPLVELNGYTNLGDADDGLPLNSNGADLINFGAGEKGDTLVTLAAGFRSKLLDNVTFGAAYEIPLTSPEGFFRDRVTVDLEFRF